MTERSAGILLPISALPSRYGIGCFSREAYSFVDFLHRAGQRYWQILPLGPTGYGDSPYQSFSTFAGNPYFIDLEALIAAGWLTARECESALPVENVQCVDYALQYRMRSALLRRAYVRFSAQANVAERRAFADFQHRHAAWLPDYAHFMALKDAYGGKAFGEWHPALKKREPEAMRRSVEMLSDDIVFYAFVQYLFFSQWDALHRYAASRGVRLIGDLPIYVAADSADIWAKPSLFQLDGDLRPTAVAGCPPDGFSDTGQLWGNPLYAWKEHKRTGYAWWIARLRHCFSMYDVVRIDHFRGFDSYYSVPFGARDAKKGHWERGAGIDLFLALRRVLGEQNIIAEDLGYMTDSVRMLLQNCGYPGMKVLQFAFDSRDEGDGNDHLPHLYPENCVAYTGTHDNQTTRAWLSTIGERERLALRSYLCDFHTPTEQLIHPMIALLMRSAARLCIIPLQDYLGYGDEARINTPSTSSGNWSWRVSGEVLSDGLADSICRMTREFGR